MTDGINIITDDKGNEKAIILDLNIFRKQGIKATEVLSSLSGLQELIDKASAVSKEPANWESAKQQLKNLKP